MKEQVTLQEKLKIIALLEAMALGIALFLPITPSKTGDGTSDLAPFFIDDPSYLESVAVGFVAVNALFLLLAWACWLYCVFTDCSATPEKDLGAPPAEE